MTETRAASSGRIIVRATRSESHLLAAAVVRPPRALDDGVTSGLQVMGDNLKSGLQLDSQTLRPSRLKALAFKQAVRKHKALKPQGQ